jgi:hypothetical protein
VALEFARHYGFGLMACDTGDAARKGKIQRPFRDLKAGFLAEADLDPPADIGELNRRAEQCLSRYAHAVVHRTTKVHPDERFSTELDCQVDVGVRTDPVVISQIGVLDVVVAVTQPQTNHRPLSHHGKPGCGKSHLAVALGIRAVEAGYGPSRAGQRRGRLLVARWPVQHPCLPLRA